MRTEDGNGQMMEEGSWFWWYQAQISRSDLHFELIAVFHYFFGTALCWVVLASQEVPFRSPGLCSAGVCATNSLAGVREEEDGSEVLQGKRVLFLAHRN